MATCGMALDTETHLIQQGLLSPPLVCGSIAALIQQIRADILTKQQALEAFHTLLLNPQAIIIGANIVFDLLVLAVEFARLGIDIMPLIWEAFGDHRIYDVQHAEALNAVADGFLGKDPRTGGPIMNPETGRRGRYSLASCVDLVLGRLDAKANDEYRSRYAELEHVPMEQWPRAAIDYPIDDARNTLEVALAQTGHWQSITVHRWPSGGPGGEIRCTRCDITPEEARGPCQAVWRHRNLHDLSRQTETAWAMHLGAAWGFRVNQASVDIIERQALKSREGSDKPFIAAGILRDDGSQDLAATKRRIAIAYGAKDPCLICQGTGKVVSPKAPLIRCPTCRGKTVPAVAPSALAFMSAPPCGTCRGVGKIPSPRSRINCATFDGAPGAEPIKTKTCDGTGLQLPGQVPRTEKEGVGYGRDVLHESGDELLMAYADWDEDKKDLQVYIPYLRQGRSCTICGQPGTEDRPHREGCQPLVPFLPPQYRDVPLTLWPNVILETGRTSYGGVIQLFKRQPGYYLKNPDGSQGMYVPSLRECIEARPGCVLGSIDYEAGELVTHSQSCIWLTGDSSLARALLNKVKPHNALAATMIGLSYEEFERRLKDGTPAQKLECKNARQAAKPPNFGYPGGMGAPKLVLQQRKQGPDTPHPSGPNWIEDGDGNPVRGYKGLRFCILMDGAEACGIQKVQEWRDRPIPPTCLHCIKCADRLKEIWGRQWPENKGYFGFISDCVEDGMVISGEMLRRWPHLGEVFRPGQQLAPGEIMQHVSGRIRGGVDFCSGANGFFQGLLADAAKSALRRVSRECYDRSVRVPDMAHANSERSKYANGPSPLFGSRVIVFQHDEVLPEFPESVAHDAVSRTSEIMVEELRWYCPDLAPACKAEPTLMRRWYKGAELVKHRGIIIPWTPEHNPKKCAECKA